MNKLNPILLIGIAFLIVLLFLSFIGPYLPFVQDNLDKKHFIKDSNNNLLVPPLPPSDKFIIGTDKEGRDLLSVLILGAKETLGFILFISIIRYLISIPLGFLASRDKYIYNILILWNRLFTYVPTFIVVLLISFIPFVLYSSSRLLLMIILIAFIEVGNVALIKKELFAQVRKKEYVTSGIVIGTRPIKLFLKYFLFPVRKQIIVHFTFDIGRNMLLLAQLGFADIFITHVIKQNETGSWVWFNNSNNWPILLSDSLLFIKTAIWIPLWTALFMSFTIFTFNLLGEGLKEYFTKKA